MRTDEGGSVREGAVMEKDKIRAGEGILKNGETDDAKKQ